MSADIRPTETHASSDEWAARLHSVLGIPPTTGNGVRVLRNGDQIFDAMLDAIGRASKTVDLLTFVYWSGDIASRFAEALGDAAGRGCRVRVLLDAVGARKLDDELLERMRDAGVQVRWFRPILDDAVPDIGDVNHRTHRKILVCDRAVGFAGGVGIADQWCGDARNADEWRDTHAEVRGPAVAGLLGAFLDNWGDTSDDAFDARFERTAQLEAAGESTCLVVRGAAETGASDVWRLLLTLIQLSEHRLRITSAYFNPDEHLVAELSRAVERGVTVQVLVPGQHADKRFVRLNGEGIYAELLERGIELKTYERSMMHAKIVTVDGAVASIGSANFNQRSMQHDEECNLVIADPAVVAIFDRHFDDDLAASADLDPDEWAERSILQRLGERATSVVDRWV